MLFVLGWRLQRVAPSALIHSSASAERWSPPLGPGEPAAQRVRRLVHDVASISLAPTNAPSPGKVLDEARTLAEKGQYEEALQRHIWYHNHALQYDPSQGSVRNSFALSYWIELGRKYPRARQALVEIRDRDKTTFSEGKGDFALFQELSAINGYLQAGDDTVAVFKSILALDPELARRCYLVAEDLLVQKGEYELCQQLFPDVDARFNSIREYWERTAGTRGSGPQMDSSLRKWQENHFVSQIRNLIEILLATGHNEEAVKIRDQALAVMDHPRLVSALADAEKKLAK